MGIGLILAGIAELMATALLTTGRFWGYVLGGLDVVLGVLALAWPQATFAVLVRLVAWVLLIRGVVDFVRAMEQRSAGIKEWWLTAAGRLAGRRRSRCGRSAMSGARSCCWSCGSASPC